MAKFTCSCGRTFSYETVFNRHLESSGHKPAEAAEGDAAPAPAPKAAPVPKAAAPAPPAPAAPAAAPPAPAAPAPAAPPEPEPVQAQSEPEPEPEPETHQAPPMPAAVPQVPIASPEGMPDPAVYQQAMRLLAAKRRQQKVSDFKHNLIKQVDETSKKAMELSEVAKEKYREPAGKLAWIGLLVLFGLTMLFCGMQLGKAFRTLPVWMAVGGLFLLGC